MFDRFAVAFSSMDEAHEVVELSAHAERLGFDSVWLAEFYPYRSAIPLATAIGGATSRIKIGLGVLPSHTRHPTLLAMEAATLDELNGGRTILGLGTARNTAKEHAVDVGLLAQMREVLTIVRGLLDGEEVSFAGKNYTLKATRLGSPPRKRLPIYIGTYANSTKTCRLTGELADGIVDFMPSPDFVRRGSRLLADGAQRGNRDPSEIDNTAFFFVSVDENEERARRNVREVLAHYCVGQHQYWRKTGQVRVEDIDPVLAAYERGGVDAAALAVSASLIETMAVAGNAAYCRDRFKEYLNAGLKMPIAYGAYGANKAESMQAIAEALL